MHGIKSNQIDQYSDDQDHLGGGGGGGGTGPPWPPPGPATAVDSMCTLPAAVNSTRYGLDSCQLR